MVEIHIVNSYKLLLLRTAELGNIDNNTENTAAHRKAPLSFHKPLMSRLYKSTGPKELYIRGAARH